MTVQEVKDSLEAIGFVLLGADDPLVVCAVDWAGLMGSTHRRWRQALAEAAGTVPDRVAIQCVHQHDAPLVCLDAQELVEDAANMPHVAQPEFVERSLAAGQRAVQEALEEPQPLTHIACGQAQVEQVASYRRIFARFGES